MLSKLLFFFAWVKWSYSTFDDSDFKMHWQQLRYFFTPGLRLDAFLHMMPSRKPCRLSSGGQLLDSTDMSPCVLCFNSWSHRLSPKLPRRRTRDILMRSSQHRPSLSHLLDKVISFHCFFSFPVWYINISPAGVHSSLHLNIWCLILFVSCVTYIHCQDTESAA